MTPRRSSRPPSPCRGAATDGDSQKGETATGTGRFPLPAIVACLALLPTLAAGCGGDEAPAQAGGRARATATVKIEEFDFKPAAVTIRKGGSVTFRNGDKAPHTAQTDLTPSRSEFDTERLDLGEERTVKLDRPGRFSYFCAFHRFMEGTVKVVE